jgi:hypothetical protein
MTSADVRQLLANYLERKARRHRRKAKHHKNKDRAKEHRRSAVWLHRLARHVLALDPQDWRLVAIGEADWPVGPDDVVDGVDAFCITQRIGSEGPVNLDHELCRFAKACASYARVRDTWLVR